MDLSMTIGATPPVLARPAELTASDFDR